MQGGGSELPGMSGIIGRKYFSWENVGTNRLHWPYDSFAVRSLQHWDRVFVSRWRNGCMSSILCRLMYRSDNDTSYKR